MSYAQEYCDRAKVIHERLIHPPNAIFDPGINLKRLPKISYTQVKKPLQEVLEYLVLPLELPHRAKIVPLADISLAVSEFFLMSMKELLGRDRHKHQAMARHILMYLATIHTRMSVSQICERIGRDHTTGLYAQRKITRMRIVDSDLDDMIRGIEARL
jgi:chromosomal replication initiator protein